MKNEEYKKDMKVLEIVKAKVMNKVYQEILQVIEDTEGNYGYKIVSCFKGEFQKEDYPILKGYYVNQTVNGGQDGDTYAGTISIKISETEYLQVKYNM